MEMSIEYGASDVRVIPLTLENVDHECSLHETSDRFRLNLAMLLSTGLSATMIEWLGPLHPSTGLTDLGGVPIRLQDGYTKYESGDVHGAVLTMQHTDEKHCIVAFPGFALSSKGPHKSKGVPRICWN